MNQVTQLLSSPLPRSLLLSIEQQYGGRGVTFSYIKLQAGLPSSLSPQHKMRINAPSAAPRPCSPTVKGLAPWVSVG